MTDWSPHLSRPTPINSISRDLLSLDGFVKKAYAANSNAPTASGCTSFGRVIKDFNLDRYPYALLWMQKIARVGNQIKARYTQLRMQFALRNEVAVVTKILISRIKRNDKSFMRIDSTIQDQIINAINAHKNLNLADRIAIVRHAMRVVMALDFSQENVWNSFENALFLGDYLPIHEESSIAASYAFNGEQLTERRPALVTVPEFLANSVQMDPPFGTQEEKKKLIEAVVSKEVLKSQMPIVFITTLEGLMQQLIPGYHYDSKAPSDAIRDITIVRSLPNGARGSATGGGLILAQSMNEYPQWAALEMFHEKITYIFDGQ